MFIIKVKKKNGTIEAFDKAKIHEAIGKSASRVLKEITPEQSQKVSDLVLGLCHEKGINLISVEDLHRFVEVSLEKIDREIAESYRSYRNYKTDFTGILDEVYKKAKSIMYVGDKENSNADSSLVSTKRSLITGHLSKELYQKFQLNDEERQAIDDGFIYVHDMRDRLYTLNCCLADVQAVMKNGFEMGNIWYNEPKSLDTACDVLGDVILSMASQQYGGYTVPHIDRVLAYYCKKSFDRYVSELKELNQTLAPDQEFDIEKIKQVAKKRVRRELEQGIQGLEIKLNTVASSRGDYVFTTFSFGHDTDEFAQMVSEVILKVRREGQGKEGFKKPVLFPKLVFIYDESLHGQGKPLEHLFNEAVSCSATSMYPDYLSVNSGYLGEMYEKYGEVVSPMGCRAFLSPYYEEGGMYPANEQDKPYFVGRFNIGAITLHLCLIYQEAKTTGKDFFELLDYYLEMIRQIHLKTYDYLGEMKASINPIGFTQGGFRGGNLDYNDKIKPLLKSATASFGLTALNELCQLHQQTSILEDNSFALEVLDYIQNKVNEFKKEDGWLYALYATPAESLVGLQVQQFRQRFGIIEGVSDKEYMSNGFHCHVAEDITPFKKQDAEEECFHKVTGGRITYTRYPLGYNLEAIKTTVRRGMAKGFYQGVNLALSSCNTCGHSGVDFEVCPNCQSEDLTKIDRMNGYLSYSRVKGQSRLNDAKMSEIRERKSM